ncbi:hypothetical protein CDN99_17230 [Roseateles aquatilis]|uniref:Uncharacterized protein n=1 Tax=Roseateles aquatilis TaxID=431061 RepID=A0A246J7T5_9BURK|nr:hypothetical protein [Roseateles aquatilis]OWQ88589.1 hypothetical protein CDN99_17230 [Roseateles aquatilis]
MLKTMQGIAATAMVAALALPMAAHAEGRWTGEFKPGGPYVSSGVNFHFRVSNVPATANCPQTWAYINETDSGAKGKIAALLLAYAQGKSIDIFVDTGDGGYCHVVEFVVK